MIHIGWDLVSDYQEIKLEQCRKEHGEYAYCAFSGLLQSKLGTILTLIESKDKELFEEAKETLKY
jgi:hypothetical protein